MLATSGSCVDASYATEFPWSLPNTRHTLALQLIPCGGGQLVYLRLSAPSHAAQTLVAVRVSVFPATVVRRGGESRSVPGSPAAVSDQRGPTDWSAVLDSGADRQPGAHQVSADRTRQDRVGQDRADRTGHRSRRAARSSSGQCRQDRTEQRGAGQAGQSRAGHIARRRDLMGSPL